MRNSEELSILESCSASRRLKARPNIIKTYIYLRSPKPFRIAALVDSSVVGHLSDRVYITDHDVVTGRIVIHHYFGFNLVSIIP